MTNPEAVAAIIKGSANPKNRQTEWRASIAAKKQAELAASPTADLEKDGKSGQAPLDNLVLDNLIANVFDSPSDYVAALDYLEPHHLLQEAHQCIWTAIKHYWADYRSVPTLAAIKVDINKILLVGDACYDDVERILDPTKNPPEPRNTAWLRNNIIKWIKLQRYQDTTTIQTIASGDSKRISTLITAIEAIGGAKEDFEVLTSNEFRKISDEIPYLIPGLLAQSEHCIIGASSKSHKTNVVAEIVTSLASGASALRSDEFKPTCRPQRILFISTESGGAATKKNIKRICKSKGLNITDPWFDNIYWVLSNAPQIDDPKDIAKIQNKIEKYSIDGIVVDPAAISMSGKDASNLTEQYHKLQPLSEWIREQGKTFILTHHFRKNNPRGFYQPPELSELGMTGYEQWAAQWILLGRREKYDANSTDKLFMSVGSRLDHAGEYLLDIKEWDDKKVPGVRRTKIWEPTVCDNNATFQALEKQKKELVRSEAAVNKVKEKIITYLKAFGATSRSNLKKNASKSMHFDVALAEMLDFGSIIEADDKYEAVH